MNVEARLRELIGPAAGRLHTARSRNDQVALDFRMWVREACDRTAGQLQALQRALLAKAEAHADALMPGFTHLQPAQPVTFGHHLMAYVEMFGRDAARFADARARMNESPLGAAALAGSPFPIDRQHDRQGAGLRPADRQLAGQRRRPRLRAGGPGRRHDLRHPPVAAGRGDRDLDDAAVRLREALPTPSPPARRSCRRRRTPTPPSWCAPRSAGCWARFTQLTVVMKGLPLTYSKDMQEDKVPTFEAFDALELSPAGHGRHGRRPEPERASGWPPRPAPASPPPPTWPTGWCAS